MSKATSTPVKDTLEKALEIIQTKGWTKGQYRSVAGKHCALGAIQGGVGKFDPDLEEAVYILLRGAMDRKIPHCGGASIVSTNDHPKTTKEQVVDSFRHAIGIAKVAGL